MDEKRMSVREYRFGIGADILEMMAVNDDLPLPNKRRVGKVMQEYYEREGYADELREKKMKFVLSAEYWETHLHASGDALSIQRVLQDRGEFFNCIKKVKRDKGGKVIRPVRWQYEWKFVTKQEYLKVKGLEDKELETRKDSRNSGVSEANVKWPKLEMAHIELEARLITEN